jgi:hypothetical protein
MKLLVIPAVALLLSACAATNRPMAPVYQPWQPRPQAVSYQQLMNTNFTMADCQYPTIHNRVNWVEDQLRMKGLLYADPDTLNDDDRLYNSRARALIWGLRVGCANPHRYDK